MIVADRGRPGRQRWSAKPSCDIVASRYDRRRATSVKTPVSEDYFQEIESHFALCRGTPFVLSAKDWALMKKWAEEAIPLPVVIEAIDSVFEKAAERQKKVNSLSYCRHAVKELWEERRALQIGASEGVPEEGAEPLLLALADALKAAAPEFAPRVRELARENSVPRIEEKLIDLERELALTLATDEIRAEAARAAEGNARAEEAHLRRLIREKFGVPRLTLFR